MRAAMVIAGIFAYATMLLFALGALAAIAPLQITLHSKPLPLMLSAFGRFGVSDGGFSKRKVSR